MKEITFRIPDESADAITTLVQQLGGSVEKEEKVEKKTPAKKRKKKEEVDHTFLFGKWKDHDIDARKLRNELWRRNFE
jgi:hypothetical protein